MDSPATKTELIALIRQERASWEALFAALGEAQMTQPGVEGPWSFKDVVAHVTAWRRRAITRLEAVRRGEAPPPAPWAAVVTDADDFEPVNQWIYRANRDRPLAEVLRDARESLDQLEAAVQAVAEPDLFEAGRFPWMGGNSLVSSVLGASCEHFYVEHEPGIRAWLAQVGAGSPVA